MSTIITSANEETSSADVKAIVALTRLSDTSVKQAPYSGICDIVIQYSGVPAGQWKYGSGFLVSPQKVLTTGHTLISESYGNATWIRVVPGRYGQTIPKDYQMNIDINNSSQCKIASGWKNSYNVGDDYAVIKLPTASVGSILTLSTTSVEGKTCTLSGYPAAAYADFHQYYGSNTASSKTDKPGMWCFDIAGEEGQIGCPLLDSSNNAVGIYRAQVPNSYRLAVKITAAIKTFVTNA